MAETITVAVLKGADVARVRPLIVSHLTAEHRAAAAEAERLAAMEVLRAAHEQARTIKDEAEKEAMRRLAVVQQEASRLLGQAQVELGRARAEAEDLHRQAQARLDQTGETISTAAEARKFLEQSRIDAEAFKIAAQQETAEAREAARRQGREEGFQAGHEAGAQTARNELLQELELVHGIAAQTRIDRAQIIADSEPEIVRLSLEIARKVIGREAQSDLSLVRTMLDRAISRAAGQDRVRVRLNPTTVDRLGMYLMSVAERYEHRGVDLVPDPAVAETGIIIETRSGAVDASVDTQVDAIGRTMLSLAGA